MAPGVQRACPELLGVRGRRRQEGGSVEASGQRGLRAICGFLTCVVSSLLSGSSGAWDLGF